MRSALWLALAPGVLLVIAVFLVIALLLVKLLWAWTVPDLFPLAVKEGYVAGQIGWLTAFKIAIFIAVLGGFSRSGARVEKK